MKSLHDAGALVFPITYVGHSSVLRECLEVLDGLVLSGGNDVSPLSYGKRNFDRRWPGDRYRDRYELEMLQIAQKMRLPILGICRGCQILNVFYGGTLFQDVHEYGGASHKHRCIRTYEKNTHLVSIESGTLLHQLYHKKSATVNSVHHQSVERLGKGLQISARAEDGIVEAIESLDPNRFVMGVQWHPEWKSPGANLLNPQKLFRHFVSIASK